MRRVAMGDGRGFRMAYAQDQDVGDAMVSLVETEYKRTGFWGGLLGSGVGAGLECEEII